MIPFHQFDPNWNQIQIQVFPHYKIFNFTTKNEFQSPNMKSNTSKVQNWKEKDTFMLTQDCTERWMLLHHSIASYIVKYLTCDGKYLVKYLTCDGKHLQYIVHFKLLNHLCHQQLVNAPIFLNNLLKIMSMKYKRKGKFSVLSHFCLVTVLVNVTNFSLQLNWWSWIKYCYILKWSYNYFCIMLKCCLHFVHYSSCDSYALKWGNIISEVVIPCFRIKWGTWLSIRTTKHFICFLLFHKVIHIYRISFDCENSNDSTNLHWDAFFFSKRKA